MPTYEYRCPEGHEFELFQKMSDDPTAPCPKCDKLAQRLLSGGAGFIFKGEGFYITDYRSDAYKKAASSEQEGATNQGEKVLIPFLLGQIGQIGQLALSLRLRRPK